MSRLFYYSVLDPMVSVVQFDIVVLLIWVTRVPYGSRKCRVCLMGMRSFLMRDPCVTEPTRRDSSVTERIQGLQGTPVL